MAGHSVKSKVVSFDLGKTTSASLTDVQRIIGSVADQARPSPHLLRSGNWMNWLRIARTLQILLLLGMVCFLLLLCNHLILSCLDLRPLSFLLLFLFLLLVSLFLVLIPCSFLGDKSSSQFLCLILCRLNTYTFILRSYGLLLLSFSGL